MPSLNPALGGARAADSPLQQGQQIKAKIRRTQEQVEAFVTFVVTEHLTIGTFLAFWRGDERAALTLRAVGQAMGVDLAALARAVAEALAASETQPLVEFQASEAAQLFATVDAIEPDEVTIGDGRTAAECFQYAAEARSALLCHVLSLLSQRYPAPTFTNLAEANGWTRAFSQMLEEAEQVIVGTQQLLCDQALAVQSHLDLFKERFELLDEQAKGAALFQREDWRGLIARTERRLLDALEARHARLAALTFSELQGPRESGWLAVIAQQTLRRAPLLGSLLLTIAGGATMFLPGARQALPAPTLPAGLREGLEELAETARFPILPRHEPTPTERFGQRAHDEVAQFFNTQAAPRGRQTITIPDSTMLNRVLDEMARFGYARREVLGLLGLNSVNDMTGALTLDVRWSQGGRPLLLPPYQGAALPAPAPEPYPTQAGAPLALVAQRFALPREQLVAANPDVAGNPAPGQVIEVPALSADVARGAEAIPWGASLEQVGRALALSMGTLADLNDIASPETWRYEGQRLLLPAAPNEVPLAQPAPTPLRWEGEAKALTSMIVHPIANGETLAQLAQRYDTTVATIMADNRLPSEQLAGGGVLLVRVSGNVAVVQSPTTTWEGIPGIRSRGGFPVSPVLNPVGAAPAPAAVAAPVSVDGEAIVARYGSTIFPSVDAMPDEVRSYFAGTVQEVSDFFNVRPGDILGILQAENNAAGFRLQQPAVSSAGALGIAQIVPRTWNGWSNSATEEPLRDLLSIEQHGGLGFDWEMREEWRAWKAGETDGEALRGANADPQLLENSVAAVARHLVHWGLTRDVAQRDPTGFEARLGDAISVYNSGKPLAEAENFVQSAANHKTTGQYVREAVALAQATPLNIVPATPAPADLRASYRALMDQTFGATVSDADMEAKLVGSPIAAEVAAGRLDAGVGAQQLADEAAREWMAQGRAALIADQPLPWPFVYDQTTLSVQGIAVQYLGRPLMQGELEPLLAETGGDLNAATRTIATRGDARLFAGARQALDSLLKRTERGLPVTHAEAAALAQTAVAGFNVQAMSQAEIEQAMGTVQANIRDMAEYRELYGSTSFRATPLSPMPRMIRAFGVPVAYQAGGQHTGIDVANPRTGGQEPLIYAVDDATVIHVGPLYCAVANACRGGQAIVLDHGNQVYSIYSHNSVASVGVGQRVGAGQPIGRQGDEGYSFGSHLHFEVHTGAPFTGDWQKPFAGGQFVDPAAWLPS